MCKLVKKCLLVISEEKSQIVHLEQKVYDRTMHEFKIGNSFLTTVDKYKYR